MQQPATGLAARLGTFAHDVSRLPGVRTMSRALHRRAFLQPFRAENHYYGVYATFAEAEAAAQSLSTRSLPPSYDTSAAARLYRSRLAQVSVSDYPLLYWLARLLSDAQRRVFDLGGHIGVSYYGFQGHVAYPEGMQWIVHDLPTTMAAGQKRAAEQDARRQLSFAGSPDDADGCDILLSNGALQYFDYSLPELLARLAQPPPHVLVNLTPMHPERDFFTLQNLSIAVRPYRVMAVPTLVAEMQALGYVVVDHWNSFERSLAIPMEPAHAVDSYHGFAFRRDR